MVNILIAQGGLTAADIRVIVSYLSHRATDALGVSGLRFKYKNMILLALDK
jgi:hypothetical protein